MEIQRKSCPLERWLSKAEQGFYLEGERGRGRQYLAKHSQQRLAARSTAAGTQAQVVWGPEEPPEGEDLRPVFPTCGPSILTLSRGGW